MVKKKKSKPRSMDASFFEGLVTPEHDARKESTMAIAMAAAPLDLNNKEDINMPSSNPAVLELLARKKKATVIARNELIQGNSDGGSEETLTPHTKANIPVADVAAKMDAEMCCCLDTVVVMSRCLLVTTILLLLCFGGLVVAVCCCADAEAASLSCCCSCLLLSSCFALVLFCVADPDP